MDYAIDGREWYNSLFSMQFNEKDLKVISSNRPESKVKTTDYDIHPTEDFPVISNMFIDAVTNCIDNGKNECGMSTGLPIMDWLYMVSRIFDLSNSVKLTPGHYHRGVGLGYISESVDMLYEIMQPLDDAVTKPYIAKKVSEYLNECKELDK